MNCRFLSIPFVLGAVAIPSAPVTAQAMQAIHPDTYGPVAVGHRILFVQYASSNELTTSSNSVAVSLAQPCITAAANEYFLPERVISAVRSRSGANGGTDVDLKVDVRTAVCQLTAKGRVRAIIDTSPKSADQAAAEAEARSKKSKIKRN
ncbi:hypothetical protein [Brucella pituitosa]|uniref:hypothetical protein n=1 Tax=Brucella pituitosa TaxID=571256 RepID=UPI0032B466DE